MFSKKANQPQVDAALAKSVNYEVTVADLALRSQKRAWFVAGSAAFMALLLAAGYLLMLPLKERTPFLVLADPYSGTATVAKLTSDLSESPVTANQAINKANIANYVIARESYDYDILRLRDWSMVWTMSSKEVGAAYAQAISQSNPDSPIKRYGKAQAIRINILSLVPTAEGWFGGKKGGATVRFQRVRVSKATGDASVLDTQVATLIYTYDETLPLDDQQRYNNPLGFQVTDYRVVTEMGGVPVEAPGAQQATASSATASPPALPAGDGAAPATSGVVVPPVPGASPASQAPAVPGVSPATVSSPVAPAQAAPASNANGASNR